MSQTLHKWWVMRYQGLKRLYTIVIFIFQMQILYYREPYIY